MFDAYSGTARLINKVCTHCLLYGAQNGHKIIDDHMVKRDVQGELSYGQFRLAATLWVRASTIAIGSRRDPFMNFKSTNKARYIIVPNL